MADPTPDELAFEEAWGAAGPATPTPPPDADPEAAFEAAWKDDLRAPTLRTAQLAPADLAAARPKPYTGVTRTLRAAGTPAAAAGARA